MSALPYQLDRTVVIRATPETVFRFFTDPVRWSAWWGAGSTIDARPGGRLRIRHPNGAEVTGEVLEVRPPEHVVFTYAYGTDALVPAGTSSVTIQLARHAAGTRLHLCHEFADEAARDEHVQGWRYQLALFTNVAVDEVNRDAAEAVDAWFDAWAEPDADVRMEVLERFAVRDLQFRDRVSNIEGLDDLNPHISAAQRFMPGIRMRRAGGVRERRRWAFLARIVRSRSQQRRGGVPCRAVVGALRRRSLSSWGCSLHVRTMARRRVHLRRCT